MQKDPVLDFQRLFESSPDQYMVLSPALNIVAATDAYLQVTLVQRSNVIGRPLFEVFPDNPDDPAADGVRNLRLSLEQVLRHRTANTMAVQKYDVRNAAGVFEERFWSCVNTPILDENGEVYLIVHRAEDVTEYIRLKRDQQALQSHAAHIEAEIYLRAQQVQKANQQLAEAAEQLRASNMETAQKNAELELASKAKSEFLANMSHELRTPLNSIIGFADVLKAGIGGTLSAKQHDCLTHISQSGQHLLALINDILDLSKVEAGRMDLDLSEIDLPLTLAASLTILKEKASLRRIRFELDVASDLKRIQLDERKFKQILYNLLSNAIKFSNEETQVTVTGRSVPRAQVGRLEAPGAHRVLPGPIGDFDEFLALSVADQGIGISQDGLNRLFEPFTQIDSGLARRFEGTGLGLVMVTRMVELHGGTVAVSSREGQGTCFTVWLPLRKGAVTGAVTFGESAALASAAAEKLSTRAGKVLVIEDDDKAAELISLQLQAEGLEVVRVETAEEGLALARAQPFSLIALDILLPGMDGWEFLARAREYPETAHIPVVIISVVADRNRGVSLGASAILQKPITQQMLHDALDSIGLRRAADRKLNVLVVDDDPRSVQIISGFLGKADCTPLCAYGGKEGVASAARDKPDLIVLDLMMPDMSGFEVVEVLKSDSRTARIPILILTAKQIDQADRDLLNGHVLQIIEKSEFNHGRFISEVRRVLGPV